MRSRSVNKVDPPAAVTWLRLILLLPAFLLPTDANAASSLADRFRDQFIDPVDGQFDTSNWLMSKKGFLPVPIIITEPAIGYGGGAAILYFHPRRKGEEPGDPDDPDSTKKYGLPPTITAAFGAGTENNTWAAGAGHFASWKQDRFRFTGGGGYANVNIAFYRRNIELDFNIKGFALDAKLEHRLWDTDFFIGAGYRYVNLTASLEGGPLGLLPFERESSIGGIKLTAHYDSRDNIFTPNEGQDIRLEGDFQSAALGGSSDWQELGYKIHSFHQVHSRVVVSLRCDGNLTWNGAPFYALPFVQMRGIPAARYQGQYAGEAEVDLRVRVWKRWHLVGFGGAGWIAGEPISTQGDNGPFWAGGGGFRYLLARKLGMQVGIDVARGPEDTAFYIQVGSAW